MEMPSFAENWPELKKKLQEQYPHLTDEDLAYEIGKEGELLKRIQARLGQTDKEITNWLHLMG
ncbi:MAG TPA: general stress protein CsbD [Flavipsychrobacter sp.]|nr:general stress protein CsbD [Flavipsychrobacter sp.]